MFTKNLTEPTLILDQKKCIANINLMVNKAKANHLISRPHFKTHQSRAIGKWFAKAGVEKIAVSSVKMAHYFANDNWKNITITFPVNIREIQSLNELAEEIQLNITVENTEAVEFLCKKLKFPVGYFIKIDTGYHRTGIEAKNIQLINKILSETTACNNLLFKGFLAHSGDTYHAKDKNEIEHIFNHSSEQLKSLKDRYIKDYPQMIISTGDTPSCSLLNDFKMIDEIRPGNFVFYDLMQHMLGACELNQIAVVIGCPVVAIHPERKEIIVHGGAVHLSKDTLVINNKQVYGQVVTFSSKGWQIPNEKIFVTKLSQEHGTIQATEELLKSVKIGDMIGIIPIHSCLTANLMKSYYTTENDTIDHLSGVTI
ncbi:MAG TPA: alanine racemase [Bacteroidales bacterium]|nr:alanine racemase [Bacteroidales bacterium]